MTIEELTIIAREFMRENYDMELAIPIKRNNRLSRAMGRYMAAWDGAPICIEIAGKALSFGTNEYIQSILRHELIHYALDVRGEPSDDGHPYFEEELRKHNAPSTGIGKVGVYYLYECGKCKESGETDSRTFPVRIANYTSYCCGENLVYVGERIYNGTEAIQ